MGAPFPAIRSQTPKQLSLRVFMLSGLTSEPPHILVHLVPHQHNSYLSSVLISAVVPVVFNSFDVKLFCFMAYFID